MASRAASKTYLRYRNKGPALISRGVSLARFGVNDGASTVYFSFETVDIIQDMQDYFNRTIQINSGYRNSQHNANVGGASGSQHMKGRAADIKGPPLEAIVSFLKAFYPWVRIIVYGTFIHFDTLNSGKWWRNTGKNPGSPAVLAATGKHVKYKSPKCEENRAATARWIAENRPGFSTVVDWKSYLDPNYVLQSTPSVTVPQKTPAEIQDENAKLLKNYLDLPSSKEKFYNIMDNYFKNLAKKSPDQWSVEARNFFEELKIISGDENGNKQYKKFITKEELSAFLLKFYKRTTNYDKDG